MTIYPWQKNNWENLLLNLDNFSQSYIFYGPTGIGINQFVKSLSFSLLCKDLSSQYLPCGKCQDCEWTKTKHPDLITIDPFSPEEKVKQISVDEIRSIKEFLSLSSHQPNGKKVVVIYDAQRFNRNSANGLLKFLEEPPEDTHILLTTNSLSNLAATIKSRCQLIKMNKPSYKEAEIFLKETGNLDLINRLPFYSNLPIQTVDERDSSDLINTIISELKSGKDFSLIGIESSWLVNGLVWVIDLLQKWTYEIIIYKITKNNNFFPNNANSIKKLATDADLFKLFNYVDTLSKVKLESSRPINKDLSFDLLLLEYKKIFN
jgi:DNA polymerase-3 subunit delta'